MECAKYDRAVIRELRRMGSLLPIKAVRAIVNSDRSEGVSPQKCAEGIVWSLHWRAVESSGGRK